MSRLRPPAIAAAVLLAFTASASALPPKIRLGRRIAFSGVPLRIWWSTRDRIVTTRAHAAGLRV